MSDPAYTHALTKLAASIEKHDLPTPACITWNTYPREHLAVQVEARYFRRWLDVLDTSMVDTNTAGKWRHMNAYGSLHGNRIHLAAVAEVTDQVPS